MTTVHIVVIATGSRTLGEESANMLDRGKRLHRAALSRGGHRGVRLTVKSRQSRNEGFAKPKRPRRHEC